MRTPLELQSAVAYSPGRQVEIRISLQKVSRLLFA